MPGDNLPEIDHVRWFLVLLAGAAAGIALYAIYKSTLGSFVDRTTAQLGGVLPFRPVGAATGAMTTQGGTVADYQPMYDSLGNYLGQGQS